ncbi:neurogenic locus notch homolog protein 2-like isoform X1 [Saccostrea cucullata]|uniref:neurogenic locus notch homolog protein 2-like isoform X1 n=1 Tax=Saccostrea cuccullata TaxID=36930 RepID=UPI002ED336AA
MSSMKKNSTIGGKNYKGGVQKQKLTIISLLLGVFLTVAVIAFITLLLIHLKVPKADVCDSHNCQYGICVADQTRLRGYTCNCTLGYVGDNCEVDACYSNGCKNGTCVADQSRIRGYKCNCTIGFDGENCQEMDKCEEEKNRLRIGLKEAQKPEQRTIILCESENGEIRCENTKRLKIESANYGRTEAAVCPGTNDGNTNCRLDVLGKLSEKCDNETRCPVPSRWEDLGGVDPCFGTYKYVEVTYNCS